MEPMTNSNEISKSADTLLTPWAVDHYKDPSGVLHITIEDKAGNDIALVHAPEETRDKIASLMAAAPILMEALEAIHELSKPLSAQDLVKNTSHDAAVKLNLVYSKACEAINSIS